MGSFPHFFIFRGIVSVVILQVDGSDGIRPDGFLRSLTVGDELIFARGYIHSLTFIIQ
jgi:hypothetical protein